VIRKIIMTTKFMSSISTIDTRRSRCMLSRTRLLAGTTVALRPSLVHIFTSTLDSW
jgi:hypothetical protein